jgi:hypothetical protein
VGVPSGTSARLEGNESTSDPRGRAALKRLINSYRTGKIFCRAFLDGADAFRVIFIVWLLFGLVK